MSDGTHTITATEALFQFGDLIENGWASLDNPQRCGFFVRNGRQSGRLNPGNWIELTDGKGNFWRINISPTNRLNVITPSHLLPAPAAWQPIDDTTPMDGRPLLLAVPHAGEVVITIGGFDPSWSGKCWVYENKRIPSGVEPTRWMPRPEPPK